ncbi:MAG: hypothetical protein ACR2IK_01785 [Chloroflexota bacterium]
MTKTPVYSLLLGLVCCLSLPPARSLAASPEGGWLPGPGAAGSSTYDGYIDQPFMSTRLVQPGLLQLSGWFVDTTAQGWAGADDVEVLVGLMNDGGTPLAHALMAQPRPDVAKALNNPYWAASGWSAAIPVGALFEGHNTLSVYAHSPARGWWYKQVAIDVAPTASAQRIPSATGYDASFPECGEAMPLPAFGIVGVNGGRAFTPNVCLAQEYAWALTSKSPVQPHVAFYINTGNPGPGVSPHWPANGTATPQPCDGSASVACAYDYGWLAAEDALSRARTVAGGLATQVPWWLDVEVENSWSADKAANSADLQGAMAALRQFGVASVGIYGLSSGWDEIIGAGPPNAPFVSVPNWRPGAKTAAEAPTWCARPVPGGKVEFAPPRDRHINAKYACY